MKQEINLRDLDLEYLIDPLSHSNSSFNVCLPSSPSSVLILVLSHYKNYDLR